MRLPRQESTTVKMSNYKIWEDFDRPTLPINIRGFEQNRIQKGDGATNSLPHDGTSVILVYSVEQIIIPQNSKFLRLYLGRFSHTYEKLESIAI